MKKLIEKFKKAVEEFAEENKVMVESVYVQSSYQGGPLEKVSVEVGETNER